MRAAARKDTAETRSAWMSAEQGGGREVGIGKKEVANVMGSGDGLDRKSGVKPFE